MATIMNKTKVKHRKIWPFMGICIMFGAAGAYTNEIYPYVSLIALFLSLIFLVISLTSIPKKAPVCSAIAIFSTLPEDYYVFENVCINNTKIEYIIICQKGIFTIECSLLNKNLNTGSQPSGKFIPIKQAIMNSKSLNDFMQKNKIGNYFVDTLLLSNFWDDKMKTYFPDIPVVKPNDFCNYMKSLEDKYTKIQCKGIAELLVLNLRIKNDIDTLKKDIANNSKLCNAENYRKTSI